MSVEEHRARKVRPSLAVVSAEPDPKQAVMAEFDKGREMSRDDVATVLRGLPKFSGRAVSTVDDVAKKILGQLVHAGSIIQTRKSAKSRPALYRKADVRKASA